MSSSEVQLTEAAAAGSTPEDGPDSAGETGPIPSSSDRQAEDDSNDSTLPDVQPVTEVAADAAAASEEKPTADGGDMESRPDSNKNDDGRRSTPEKADSDVSAQCTTRMVTTKSRGGRSYQESRRSKKAVGEKSKSVSGSSARQLVDAHELDVRCLEQKGKGDVQDARMQEQEESLRHVKDSCHPTCDGDQPALVNVIIDEHDMRKRYALLICG